MATKRNNPEEEKKHKLRHRAPPPPSSFEKKGPMNKVDKEAKKEQALFGPNSSAQKDIFRLATAHSRTALSNAYTPTW
jgi:hypothetical protein